MLSRWLRRVSDTEELSVDCSVVVGVWVRSSFRLSVSACASMSRYAPNPEGVKLARIALIARWHMQEDGLIVVVRTRVWR